MKKSTLVVFTFVFFLASAQGASVKESSPFLCASIDVQECIDGGKCERVLPEEVNAPVFFRVDIQEQTVGISKSGAPLSANHFEETPGRFILQGIDFESADVDSDSVAWTIVLEKETSRMVATAVITQAAIVIFGACTNT
jgi:hypothetical protein